jgi:hypothetical protein
MNITSRPTERIHPVTTAPADRAKVQQAERVLRLIWVVAAGAILFSMLTVTPLVQRVTPPEWQWTAFILPLVVDVAVIIVVHMDTVISRLGDKPGGWASVLRWMTGLFTLGLNIGDSALDRNLVGVAIHSVAPMLLIATSEAAPRYRRSIAAGLERIAREQAAEQARREQQRTVREQQQRQEREQQEARREQLDRERREQEQREAREQREHAAALARQAHEHQARLKAEEAQRAEEARQADLDRQERIRLAELAAQERREQSRRDDERRREQEAQQEKQRRAAVREQQQTETREHPGKPDTTVREHRPLHSVNTQKEAPANTRKAPAVNNDKLPEAAAVNTIRQAVNSGQVSVRGLARETGWSPAWVSGQVAELRGEEPQTAAADAEQVSA